MSTLRTGVVGVGHMGTNHARIYSRLEGCTFSAVYDKNHDAARHVAKKYGTYAASSLEEFAGLVDAATICTPTVTHYEIGAFLLERGKHLLVEKPIADTPASARALSELAASRSCVLQVGHVERFNPVLTALERKLKNPRFLEVTRLSPYPNRSTDIGVVLDLMIHDIEIILHIVRSPIVSMDPVGIAVLSNGEDIANVRFRFESGCVANVTASRISRDRVRKIRVFQENAYLSLDYQKQDGVMYRLDDGPKGKEIIRDKVEILRGEPLKIELEAFIHCAREGAKPKVSGHEAADALDIALEITRRIEEADPRKKSGQQLP
ncbi:MAG TPA: Gfo/Idh/MocA family oxidoreductase [Terrimicrobiaceae bacterium]